MIVESQNVTPDQPFHWSERKERAAALLAADELTDEQIANDVGVHRRQIIRWKQHPDFAARINSILDEMRERIVRRGIAELQNRVDAENERWQLMRNLITARAEDGSGRDGVPGAATGLLVPKPRLLKVYDAGVADDDSSDEGETLYSAKRSVIAYEWAVDTGLLHEMREIEKQAAQMLGEWSEKRELTGPGGMAVQIEYVNDWRDRAAES